MSASLLAVFFEQMDVTVIHQEECRAELTTLHSKTHVTFCNLENVHGLSSSEIERTQSNHMTFQ